MTTFITIIFVITALVMVLTILLQSGKGGGLGSALGGGASQSVFGGAGGADFMSKMTQGFAATFMITAMYLAYASAHAGSDFLASEDEGSEGLFETDQEVDAERLGPNPLNLPSPEEGKRMQASASASVPAQSPAPAIEDAVGDAPVGEAPAEDAPAEDAPADAPAELPATDDAASPDAAAGADPNTTDSRGDSPRGDSPQGGMNGLQDAPENPPTQDAPAAADGGDTQPG